MVGGEKRVVSWLDLKRSFSLLYDTSETDDWKTCLKCCIKYFICCVQLLNDVSLVVSRCRLLGEEIRLLKMWGGLRLNILDISCTDSQ